jgi:DNA-binding transcriptional LysR family regulator
MNIETLKVFSDVVRKQSFSQGAAINGISQSAASQAINQLERQLGIQLIDRTKRPFILTPEGEVYYEGVRKVLQAYEAAEAGMYSLRQEMAGQVRVAAIYSIGLHDMGRCMQDFMSRYPKAKLRLEYLRPNQVYEAVLQEDVDLGIVSYPAETREITTIPLRSEKMVLVCHPDHHLARHKSVEFRQLHGENYVAFDQGLAIRKELDCHLREHQVVVRVVMEFDNIETIKQAIEIGTGVSILPEPTVRKEVSARELVAVPIAHVKLDRPIGIIHRQRKIFSPTLQRFIEILQAHAERPGGERGAS